MRNLGFAWLNDGLIKMSRSPNGIKFPFSNGKCLQCVRVCPRVHQ